jgi:hypothetical protein
MSVVIISSVITPVPVTVVPASAVIIGVMIVITINGTCSGGSDPRGR